MQSSLFDVQAPIIDKPLDLDSMSTNQLWSLLYRIRYIADGFPFTGEKPTVSEFQVKLRLARRSRGES